MKFAEKLQQLRDKDIFCVDKKQHWNGRKQDIKIKEDELLKLCMLFLKNKYPNLYKVAFHVNNEGKKNIISAKRDKNNEKVKPGVSDIIILTQVPCAIELKSSARPLAISEKQEEFLENVALNGGRAAVIYDYDDFCTFIEMHYGI